ncbi:MAG: hypothetical protein JKY48_13495 [Flavobacteriales bacterium]|nr:hypothetical protein [Flavobacteriales bacterium]
MKSLLFTLSILLMTSSIAQDKKELPFVEISETPKNHSAGSTVSRMIDGLGYRYYWASEALTNENLNYKPSEDSRNTIETIQHIYDLSVTIKNVAAKKVNLRPYVKSKLSYEELREATLFNLKEASELFAKTEHVEEHVVAFQKADKTNEYPFWNFLNGPLADAIYHTGQIVSFRRTSGNPMSNKVRVFTGKNAE